MVAVFKLIFDISIYYALSGFYLQLLFDAPPSAVSMLLLCAAVILHRLFLQKMPRKWSHAAFVIPLGLFAFSPGYIGWLHLLPVWGYAIFSMVTDRSVSDYKIFREQVRKRFLLLLILIPGLLFADGSWDALSGIGLSLILLALSGIACLRCLRERNENMRQLTIMLVITLACAVLTMLGVPQWLMGLLNKYVIQLVLRGIKLLLMLIAYCIFALFEWLVSINGTPQGTSGSQSMMSVAEIMGVEEGMAISADGRILWLEIAGYIVAAVAILFLLFLLVRKIIRSGKHLFQSAKQKGWEEEHLRLESDEPRKRLPRIRPKDPRKAVRYYYGRYMQLCRKRGIKIHKSWTCRELGAASSPVFPVQELSELETFYEAARYNTTEEVQLQHVKQMSAIWKKLKKAK